MAGHCICVRCMQAIPGGSERRSGRWLPPRAWQRRHRAALRCPSQPAARPASEVSRHGREVSFYSCEVSRHGREVSCHDREVSRHGREVSFYSCEVSRPGREVSRPDREVSRRDREVSRHGREVSFYSCEVSRLWALGSDGFWPRSLETSG